MYIHQLENWPHFNFSESKIEKKLSEIHDLEIKLMALMSVAGIENIEQLDIDNIVIEIINNFEIEAVRLNADDVRSSLLKKLGFHNNLYLPTKRNVDGYVEAILDAVKNSGMDMTHQRLFNWHSCIFHNGKTESGISIDPGRYRNLNDGKMTVSSGLLGQEKIHFIAPMGDLVMDEMNRFIDWFNEKDDYIPVLKSAIAHLYFITIHPFNDGNGRLCRALSDMVLSRNHTLKYYSISEQIQAHKKEYYHILEKTQKQKDIDITDFILWYLDITYKALKVTETRIENIFREVKFYDKHRNSILNKRQRDILKALLKQEIFNKLNTAKYAKYFSISNETASRDLVDLYKKGIIVKLPAGGRETAYYIEELGLPDEKAFGKSKQLGF